MLLKSNAIYKYLFTSLRSDRNLHLLKNVLPAAYFPPLYEECFQFSDNLLVFVFVWVVSVFPLCVPVLFCSFCSSCVFFLHFLSLWLSAPVLMCFTCVQLPRPSLCVYISLCASLCPRWFVVIMPVVYASSPVLASSAFSRLISFQCFPLCAFCFCSFYFLRFSLFIFTC